MGRSKRYLDTVPDDILRIVFRYLTDRPHHRHWHPYISAHLVSTALDVGGALAHAASVEFQNIGVEVGGEDGVPIDYFRDMPLLRTLAYRLPLRRLVLDLPREEELLDLLFGCGAELRELVLDASCTVFTKSDIFAISGHCTNLSLLSIHLDRAECTLASIWRCLGSNLTQLSIKWNDPTPGFRIREIVSIPDLVEHCVNLHRIGVSQMNDVSTNVLTRLGPRVHVLDIDYDYVPIVEMWHEVCTACTNLEAVHTTIDSSVADIDFISLMRTKLVSLTFFELHDLMPLDDRFFSVLSACSVLKEVSLFLMDSIPEVQVRELFESLKSVTTLMIAIEVPGNANNDMIDAVACKLRNLESFTMSAYEPLKENDVDGLIDLPFLKSVILAPAFEYTRISKHLEKCVAEVLNKLKDCAQLVLLEINNENLKNKSSLIAEAAAMYNRKDFDMFIGGVQYRTW